MHIERGSMICGLGKKTDSHERTLLVDNNQDFIYQCCIFWKNLPRELAGKGALPCRKSEVEFSSDIKRSCDEKFSIVTIKIRDENVTLINITSFCE